MDFSMEDLYRARDFLDIKKITDNRIELSFRNAIIAMLAKTKVDEIANMCGPDEAFQSLEQNGNDLVLEFNSKLVDTQLLAEIFTAPAERAEQASKELAEYVDNQKNA